MALPPIIFTVAGFQTAMRAFRYDDNKSSDGEKKANGEQYGVHAKVAAQGIRQKRRGSAYFRR